MHLQLLKPFVKGFRYFKKEKVKVISNEVWNLALFIVLYIIQIFHFVTDDKLYYVWFTAARGRGIVDTGEDARARN